VQDEAPNFLDPFFVIETSCTAWFTVVVDQGRRPSRTWWIKTRGALPGLPSWVIKNMVDQERGGSRHVVHLVYRRDGYVYPFERMPPTTVQRDHAWFTVVGGQEHGRSRTWWIKTHGAPGLPS